VLVAAADTFKRVVLELGGKSALIVFADADLNDAGLAAALGAFTVHCGQGCALTTRILVEAAAHDEVVTRLQSMLSSLVIGPPSDPRSMMGPLIREAQRERVERYVQIGRDEGATLAFGGGRPAAHRRGYYVEPTLFVNVHNRMRIAQEEIFGPVGVVIPFATTDEAIALANDSRYGLAGSVWSADRARAFTVAQRIRAGFLSINGGNGELGGPIGYAPFGGYKHSGLGREHGEAGAEEFLELKTVDYPIC
jgi:aldehyde dehydrogenase (NAD+)